MGQTHEGGGFTEENIKTFKKAYNDDGDHGAEFQRLDLMLLDRARHLGFLDGSVPAEVEGLFWK